MVAGERTRRRQVQAKRCSRNKKQLVQATHTPPEEDSAVEQVPHHFLEVVVKEEIKETQKLVIPPLPTTTTTPTSTSHDTTKRKPRRVTPYNFSAEQEQDIGEWFRDNELLYNRLHKEYKFAEKKKRILEDKAATFHPECTYKQLKMFLDNMRTQYGRLSHPKSGKGAQNTTTPRDAWIMHTFRFLEKHIVRISRPSQSSTKSSQGKSLPDLSSGEEQDKDKNGVESMMLAKSTDFVRSKRKKRSDSDKNSNSIAQGEFPSFDSTKRKPRRITPYNFSAEQEQDIGDWFRDNEILYNRLHKEYKFVEKKKKILEDKAAMFEPECTYAQLKMFLDNMRTQYGRLSHPKSGKGLQDTTTPRDAWILCTFGFLEKHIVRTPRPSISAARSSQDTVLPNLSSGEEQDKDDKANVEGMMLVESRDIESTTFVGFNSKMGQGKGKRRSVQDKDNNMIAQNINHTDEQAKMPKAISAPSKAQFPHEELVDSYIGYLAKQLRLIPPIHWFNFTVENQKLVQSYILRGYSDMDSVKPDGNDLDTGNNHDAKTDNKNS